ncbi:acyl-CoA dehydrogenase family protein [Streptomyces sp. VRA16 Mangrove soil]|uniref:acyl-CoA dehydrogenase family protein n=1 Tax=Streptomyces sp. VRA16 Mangrove soil TaxID=2817434 RepID=UPI001A9D303E|nr:acyl-CoA dehydrogenase family protein [Streptomyces sp. VRA16 Mangrove soil]MBO1332628.1 hydrolase [Streptomyces sp. VRA16 Mangrove soil]
MSEHSNAALGARASHVAEVAARGARAAETARRLSPEVVGALVDAGFARHFVPRAHGGADGGFVELSEAVARVGEGCAAAAWTASLAAYAARYAAFLPEAGQADVWADGPDTLIAGALIPSGKAEPTAGGWRLTGAWSYISGVHVAAWVLACASVPGPDPDGPAQVRFFAVPRHDLAVEETWFPVGMRGTGSDTMVLTDVFVPEQRSFPRAAVLAGEAPASRARCHTVPMQAVGALPFAAPLLGAVRGALRTWTARMSLRTDVRGRAVRELRPVQTTLARAAGEADAAELLLLRTARVADGSESAPEGATAVRGARDTALATELLVTAVDRVFRAGGTSGQAETDPLQRFWRDVNTAATHVALDFESSGAAYGAWALSGREGALTQEGGAR